MVDLKNPNHGLASYFMNFFQIDIEMVLRTVNEKQEECTL